MARDGHIVNIQQGTREETRDLEMAKAITVALNKAYPNHYWGATFTSHALVVRHALIAAIVSLETGFMMPGGGGQAPFGSLLPRDKIGTIHEAEAEAVKHGGALLEAFGLPRGAWNGIDLPKIPPDLKKEIIGKRRLKFWKF